MVVTEIGLAPAAPAEFIVVRIIHGPAGVEHCRADLVRCERCSGG